MSQLFTQTPLTVVVAGANGAIGQALVAQLLDMPNVQRIYALHRTVRHHDDARVVPVRCDITQSDDLQALTQQLKNDAVAVNLLINATGLLHSDALKPEKALNQVNLASLQTSFATNAFAPILLLQAVLPCFDKQQPAWVINLSARVGSIKGNRLGGWFSYRAAKAAQNQLLKTASIELKRSHPLATCLQLHPGTVNSGLSKPFQSAVKAEQLFTPQQSAAYLLAVMACKEAAETGTFWDWNNQAIPW
jgi:NAD(P)-dependent dehydrogenase (short-subunit alcohol dehydrogenase family)